MLLEKKHIWQLAVVWVKSNRVLINCISAQYISYMGCNSQDIESEALLVAYQTLTNLFHNNKDLSYMGRYFRVVFRSRCIQMTMGINVVADIDIDRINISQEERSLQGEHDKKVIDATFTSLTHRQRQVAKWILSQPSPVNANLIGEHFGISTRGVRRLINNAINRIENGHRRVCQTVTAIS